MEIARAYYVVITVPVTGRSPVVGSGGENATASEDLDVPEGQLAPQASVYEAQQPTAQELVAMSLEDALSCWCFSRYSSKACSIDMGSYASNRIFSDVFPVGGRSYSGFGLIKLQCGA